MNKARVLIKISWVIFRIPVAKITFSERQTWIERVQDYYIDPNTLISPTQNPLLLLQEM